MMFNLMPIGSGQGQEKESQALMIFKCKLILQ